MKNLIGQQGHLVVHIYFISVDTFYEIGLDFHAISRKNVNIRGKLKSKAEPKTIVKPKNKETLSSPGRRGFLTSPVHSAQLILNFTINSPDRTKAPYFYS